MSELNRIKWLDEAYELANDPEVFDQETGELQDTYYLKTIVIPKSEVVKIPRMAEANPELQRVADNIVDTLMAEYGKSEVHAILALAGGCSLPREVLKEDANQYRPLAVALGSAALFHQIAAEVAVEVGETWTQGNVPDEAAQFFDALAEAGFIQVAPGVWESPRNEQDR